MMIDKESPAGSWAEAIKHSPNIKVSNMEDYKFTQNWFSWAPPVWEQLIPLLPERKAFLEIGSFEGRSTVWIIENMMEPDSLIDCIDTWGGGEEHSNGEINGAEARFDHNVALAKTKFPERKVTKWKGLSRSMLSLLYEEDEEAGVGKGILLGTYDFIYIDGSHTAPDVLTDACMAWPMLKQGGIMVFDDYLWGDARDALHRPKVAIDAFVNIFAEQVDVIHSGYQFVVRKK